MVHRVEIFISYLSVVAILFRAHESLGAPGTIRVAIFSDAGATKAGVTRVENCLPESEGFEAKPITAEQIRSGALRNFDVLIHPGGSASKQAETLGEKGRNAVKKFV